MERKFDFFYETNANGSYIVLKLKEETEIISHQLKMLLANEIPQTLPLHIRYEDGEAYISYYITSKQPLQKLLERKKLTIEQLLELMQGVCRGLTEANRYLLFEGSYLIDFEYLYVNPVDFGVSMIYLPLQLDSKEVNTALRQLFNRLLLYVSEEEEGIDKGCLHKIFLMINQEDFSIAGISKEIKDIRLLNTGGATAQQSRVEKKPLVEAKEDKRKDTPEEAILHKKAKFVIGLNREGLMLALSQVLLLAIIGLLFFEERAGVLRNGKIDWTRLIGFLLVLAVLDYFVIKQLTKAIGSSAVTTASEESKKSRALTDRKRSPKHQEDKEIKPTNRNKPNRPAQNNDTQFVKADAIAFLSVNRDGFAENIAITKSSFIIGKLKEQVDCLLDVKTISRLHAEISYIDDIYYIKDLNSKNGTYINGERIESNRQYQLNNGDLITFADQSMSFNRAEGRAV